MRFFFYGTLCDPAVRARVLGPLAVTIVVERAALHGWRRYLRRGIAWPMVRRCPGTSVEGVLACGLDRMGARLLDAYEGDLYRRRRVWVRCGARRLAARVYVPKAR